MAVGAWMLWRKKSRKVVSWMWLIAGFCVSGGLVAVLTSIFGQVGGVGGRLFGVGATVLMGIIGAVMLLEFWHGAHPRKGSPAVHHPILALLAPILIGTAAGGLLHQIFVGLSQLVGHLSGPVTALFGG